MGKVIVVSAKSWHGGLQISKHLKNIKKTKVQKAFREVALPIWSKALREKVRQLTGRDKFILYFVCASYKEAHAINWMKNKIFLKNIKGCEIKILDMKTMIQDIWNISSSITPAHSQLSRLLQMIYHSKGKLEY